MGVSLSRKNYITPKYSRDPPVAARNTRVSTQIASGKYFLGTRASIREKCFLCRFASELENLLVETGTWVQHKVLPFRLVIRDLSSKFCPRAKSQMPRYPSVSPEVGGGLTARLHRPKYYIKKGQAYLLSNRLIGQIGLDYS